MLVAVASGNWQGVFFGQPNVNCRSESSCGCRETDICGVDKKEERKKLVVISLGT